MACIQHTWFENYAAFFKARHCIIRACKPKMWMDPIMVFLQANADAVFSEYMSSPTCTCQNEDKETDSGVTLKFGGSWDSDIEVEMGRDVAHLSDVESDIERVD